MLIHPIRIARGNRVDSLILKNAVSKVPDWYFLCLRCRIFLPPVRSYHITLCRFLAATICPQVILLPHKKKPERGSSGGWDGLAD